MSRRMDPLADIKLAPRETVTVDSTRLEEDFLERHALFLPPWRERLLGVGLGPPYGPRSAAAYSRLITEYCGSRGGGGLWDDEMDPPKHSRPINDDAERMRHFVERHAQEIPLHELEAYYAVYRDGCSLQVAARRTGHGYRNTLLAIANLRRRQERKRKVPIVKTRGA